MGKSKGLEIGSCVDARGGDAVLSAMEAAKFLKLSPRTLEKWRSAGSGPRVLRLGRRVAYARSAIVQWLAEEEARGRKDSALKNDKKEELVQVSSWPYSKNPNRQQVSIQFDHPLDPGTVVRHRKVAPAGKDQEAAIQWGKEVGNQLYRDVLRKPRPSDDAEEKEQQQAKTKSKVILTLAEFWPMFEEGYVADLKHSTGICYQNAWVNQIRDLLGARRLDEIDEQALSSLRKRMRQERKLSITYTRQVCDKACSVLRYAKSEGSLPKDHVMPELRWPKYRRPKLETYSREQLETFVASARHGEERLLYLLVTDGVLRIGECAGLMWKDINLRSRTMEISRNVSRGVLQDTAKGEDGIVPLSPRLAEAFRAFPRQGEFVFQPEGEYGNSKSGHEYVTDGTLSMRARRGQEAAGMPAYGPHRVRHSVLTLLAELGVSPYALQAFARHARMATTMKYYIHLNQAALAAQAVPFLSSPDASGNAMATPGTDPENIVPA